MTDLSGIVHQLSIGPGGFPNHPVESAEVTKEGVVGDKVRHPKIHGRPDQAICLYSLEDLEKIKEKGFDLFPGAVAENITTEGIDFNLVRVGDVYQIGGVAAQITNYRTPCGNLEKEYGNGLNSHMWDERSKKYDYSSELWGMTGFYARIIKPGQINQGDSIVRITQGPDSCSKEYVDELKELSAKF